jgi:hypothetical protein
MYKETHDIACYNVKWNISGQQLAWWRFHPEGLTAFVSLSVFEDLTTLRNEA